jgi:esterase/lipase superfamily enzyme
LSASAQASDAGRLCTIATANLLAEGSAAPPGDVVEVSIMLAPGIKDARVEVEAFLVTGEGNADQAPVDGKTDKYRRASGAFVATSMLAKDGIPEDPKVSSEPDAKPARDTTGASGFERRIVVPFKELDIPIGEHQFGYAVLLIADGELVDVLPLPLSRLTVTDGVRKIMEPARTITRNVPEQEMRDFLVIDGDKVTQESVAVTIQRPVMAELTSERSVTIPGEFRREQVFGADGLPSDDNAFKPSDKRTIFFVTNRKEKEPLGKAAVRFANQSIAPGEAMLYGAYEVSVPQVVRDMGHLNQPERRWGFWTESPDPKKHFLVLDDDPASTPRLSLEEFSKRLDASDTLVYVHGFNNSFNDAMVRAAQLQHDLQFPGNMTVFSWPSAGTDKLTFDFTNESQRIAFAYDYDKQQATASAPFLAKALEQVIAAAERKNPRGRVHVIAHSMGNYVLLNALTNLVAAMADRPAPRSRLGEVVLAAPDVTAGDFLLLQDDLFAVSDRVTLYCSPEDNALTASRLRNLDKPVGLQVIVLKGKRMDTIWAKDFSEAFYDFNDSHSYFGNTRALLTDLRYLLNRHSPPAERRPPLGDRQPAPKVIGAFYWEIAP